MPNAKRVKVNHPEHSQKDCDWYIIIPVHPVNLLYMYILTHFQLWMHYTYTYTYYIYYDNPRGLLWVHRRRLGKGWFSLPDSCSPPRQFPFFGAASPCTTLRACVFFMNSLTFGLSCTRPCCLWEPKIALVGPGKFFGSKKTWLLECWRCIGPVPQKIYLQIWNDNICKL